MQLEIYQWLVPLVGLFFMIRLIRQFINNKRTLQSLMIWSIFWVTIIVLAIIPNEISHRIATILGFKDNVNAIIFVALGMLFIMVFYLFNALERMDRRLTQVIRTVAIQDKEEPNDKSSKKKANK